MKSVAARVAGIYVVLGALWIHFSDRVVAALVQDRELLTDVSTAKGWTYVLVTGALLYTLIARYTAQRDRAEASVRDSESRLRTIFEQAPIGVVITRAGLILYANPAYANMLGYDRPDDLVGSQVVDHIGDQFHAEVAARMQQREQGLAPPASHDLVSRRQDGVEFPSHVNAIAVNLPDGPALVAFLTDLTERKALEDRLAQASKMEAIGRLAGGVAHDFNNVLTAILGFADEAAALEGPQRKRALDGIHDASMRAAALTRQLLAFARKQVVEPVVVDPNALVTGVKPILHRTIGEHIEILTVLREDAGSVRIDEGQLEQVLLNLAINARDAMPDGGKMTIETAAVELDSEYARCNPDAVPGEYVMIAVSDTGIGMTEEVRRRAFEPFFSGRESGQGTGLGLATSFGIVKQAGGNIGIYSEPGQGTSVKAYLPRVKDEKPSIRRELPVERPGGTETVLVVEDEAMVREVAVLALRSHGYTVLDAGSGAEMLQIAAEFDGRVHLLVTDVVMPKMSGKQLADRLLDARPNVKVLYTSGYTDNTIVHQGVLDPGVSFLQKPYTMDLLLRTVRHVLDEDASVGGATSLPQDAGL